MSEVAPERQGRIEYLDPGQLDDNPANWKFHPPEQLEVIRESLSALGHLKPLGTYNERTRRLLDGHARKTLLAGSGPVPIWVVDLPAELEPQALATLDPSGWTSVADKRKFSDLLARVPKLTGASGKLLDAVRSSSRLLGQEPDEQREDDRPSVEIPLDTLWPSDNAFDVPTLDIHKQATEVVFPVTTWGSIGHSRAMLGTYHFYTWDHKFEPLWRRPHRVCLSGCRCVVEPNFSTVSQTPLALSLYHVYRKRWLGRYWQARGLSLLVDLNVEATLNAPHEALGGAAPNLLGVPKGWAAYASRAHSNQPECLEDEFKIAQEHSGLSNPLFLCVGGGRAVKQLAKTNGWVWVQEQVEQALGHSREQGLARA